MRDARAVRRPSPAEAVTEEFRQAVLTGLAAPQKSIPPKYFYDARGSALFERICALPEYYPTRAELEIFATHAPDFAAAIGPEARIVEFGSGAAIKVRHLLDALEAPAAYVPIDISAEPLNGSAAELRRRYPGLHVQPVTADYMAPFSLPPARRPPRRTAALFAGSTIGNFLPGEARGFLRRVARLVGTGGLLLIGVDLKKDPATLHAAYNDTAGVTAAFNLNLLIRINRELEGELAIDRFRHRAHYDPARGRIEMHLESLIDQHVVVSGERFAFAAGETIHTENSYKYAIPEFQAFAAGAGFAPVRAWTDRAGLFSVHLLRSAL